MTKTTPGRERRGAPRPPDAAAIPPAWRVRATPGEGEALLAHELLRRLAALRVLSEAAALALAGGRDPGALLATLAGEIGDLERLGGELLGMGGVTRQADVAGLARQAAQTVRLARAADVHVRADGPLPVRTDAALLRQALENLIENAARYGGGAPVEVVARPAGQGAADGVDVLVLDRGPGMAAGDARGRGGHGLGLAVVRRFARRSGSRLWVAGRAGGGSVVRLWLPAEAHEQAGGMAAAQETEREAG